MMNLKIVSLLKNSSPLLEQLEIRKIMKEDSSPLFKELILMKHQNLHGILPHFQEEQQQKPVSELEWA
jgi:hypothetical protein